MFHKKRTSSFGALESGLQVPDSQYFFRETRSPFERGLKMRHWVSFLERGIIFINVIKMAGKYSSLNLFAVNLTLSSVCNEIEEGIEAINKQH